MWVLLMECSVGVLQLRWQRGSPTNLTSAHTYMGSLGGNKIGAAGARDLGAALQVNTTLTTLE